MWSRSQPGQEPPRPGGDYIRIVPKACQDIVVRRVVQRILAVADAQKTRSLLKCLSAQTRYVQQVMDVLEPALFIPVFHHSPGEGRADARHISQERV